jgi:hypothetical protein
MLACEQMTVTSAGTVYLLRRHLRHSPRSSPVVFFGYPGLVAIQPLGSVSSRLLVVSKLVA